MPRTNPDLPDALTKGGDSVRSVGRALDILLAFTREHAELTVSELLLRVDLSRPTLYRLLYSLEAKGFIASSGDPQRFRLGPAVAHLSNVWTTSLDIATAAEPVMRQLWLETRETVALFVPQGDLRLCVAEMASPQPLSFRRGVGSSERLVRGASGRAILAFMPDIEKRLGPFAKGTDVDLVKMRAVLRRTREVGYATSQNELIAGAAAVAAPFFDGRGVAGAIGVFGPVARVGPRESKTLGTLVSNACGHLSNILGAGGEATR